MSRVVRIEADAVATNKTRAKWNEIPFAASRLKDGISINPNFIKDDGKLINKSNVNIALSAFRELAHDLIPLHQGRPLMHK